MDDSFDDAIKEFVGQSKVNHCLNAEKQRNKKILHVLTQGKIPLEGWDDATISYFLNKMSCLDTNNFVDNVGMGEREGRVFSKWVFQRHEKMTHGIGRSGNLYEMQPKAMGSSLIYKLCNKLVCHAINLSGLNLIKKCIVIPVATGMALTLCMSSIKKYKPNAKYVIWSRIDQKSCFKCIITAGFIPIVIDTKITNDYLETDVDLIQQKINEYGQENILCVLSTTSCFAPRHPDKINEIAYLCYKNSLFHIVNNAYGVQSTQISSTLNNVLNASESEITLIVQSTDKNFMVPVGASVITSTNFDMLNAVAENYPGRASFSSILDIFVTLLEMGQKTYLDLIKTRKENFEYLIQNLVYFENRFKSLIKIMETPKNKISIAVSLLKQSNQKSQYMIYKIGAKLFYQHVTGARFVKKGNTIILNGHEFLNWGQHTNNYKYDYITFAVSIGATKQEIDTFLKRFKLILKKIEYKQ